MSWKAHAIDFQRPIQLAIALNWEYEQNIEYNINLIVGGAWPLALHSS